MALTDAQIADGLAGRYGSPAVTWRLTNVDRRGNARPVGNTSSPDLTPALLWEGGDNPGLEGGRISVDHNREAVTEASLTLLLDEVAGGVEGIDHVQLWEDVTIQPSGTADPETVSFSLGLFVPSFSDVTRHWDGRRVVALTLHDLTAHLLDVSGTAYQQDAATGYHAVLRDILDTQLGMRTDLPLTGPTLPMALSRPRDWRWYDIARDVTDGINRFPVWPDRSGIWRTRERVTPTAETPAVTYTTAVEPRMIDTGAPYVRSLDAPLVDNRRVVVSDFGETHITAPKYVMYENADPTSRVSTTATGVPRIDEVSADTRPSTRAILDKDTMRDIARYELRSLAAQAEPARFDTFPDPRRGPRESYLLTVEGAETAQLVRVASWSRALKPGAPMTHHVEVVTPVAITELLQVEAE